VENTTDSSPLYSHRYLSAHNQPQVQAAQPQVNPFDQFPHHKDEAGNLCVSIPGTSVTSPSRDTDDSFVGSGTFLTSIPEKMLCLPTFPKPSATVSSNKSTLSLIQT
jgi:hypothetical protein